MKRTKIKNLARKGDKEKVNISGANRRTQETKEEDNLEKMCIDESATISAKAEDASLHLAPKNP